MSVSTPHAPSAADGDLLIWNDISNSAPTTFEGEVATRPGSMWLGRFSSFALPIMVAASWFAPMPEIRRRVLSTTATSSPAYVAFDWVSDEIWIKTQAWTTQAEIDALNALLNLDLREGPDVRVAADD